MPKFLDDLDLSIFSVGSSTSDHDKISLLRLQKIISEARPGYTYLEIGSDRGGSLVPYLRDPNCGTVLSVDLRPMLQPDERGASFPYPIDGEAQMLANLRAQLSSAEMTKLKTFRQDIRDVDVNGLPKVDIALIDGEHTNVACFADADRILDLVAPDAIIAFHDSNLISDAIQNFERMLIRLGIRHATVLLPHQVGAIAIGEFAGIAASDLIPLSAERPTFFKAAQLTRWQAIADNINCPVLTDRTNEIERLTKLLNISEAKVAALLSSSSWKLTAPLRALAKLRK